MAGTSFTDLIKGVFRRISWRDVTAAVEPQLVEDWRDSWRFWSVRLGVVGSVVTSVLIAFPDVALSVWSVMPDDIKAMIPERYTPIIGVVIFVTALIARVLKQPGLDNVKDVSPSQETSPSRPISQNDVPGERT